MTIRSHFQFHYFTISNINLKIGGDIPQRQPPQPAYRYGPGIGPGIYTRPVHQMHFPTYSSQYYSPYPQHPQEICYTTPYQHYYAPKVYPTTSQYRRYVPAPYFAAGSATPNNIYDPANSAPQPNTNQLLSQTPSSGQHMEHYPGSLYYPAYNPNSGGQCYNHNIQSPYMGKEMYDNNFLIRIRIFVCTTAHIYYFKYNSVFSYHYFLNGDINTFFFIFLRIIESPYPPNYQCPMQSYPKNVHTGPLIGSIASEGPVTSTHLLISPPFDTIHHSSMPGSSNPQASSSLPLANSLHSTNAMSGNNNNMQCRMESNYPTSKILVSPETQTMNPYLNHNICESSLTTDNTNNIDANMMNSVNKSKESAFEGLTPSIHYSFNKNVTEPETSLSPARGSTGITLPLTQAEATQPIVKDLDYLMPHVAKSENENKNIITKLRNESKTKLKTDNSTNSKKGIAVKSIKVEREYDVVFRMLSGDLAEDQDQIDDDHADNRDGDEDNHDDDDVRLAISGRMIDAVKKEKIDVDCDTDESGEDDDVCHDKNPPKLDKVMLDLKSDWLHIYVERMRAAEKEKENVVSVEDDDDNDDFFLDINKRRIDAEFDHDRVGQSTLIEHKEMENNSEVLNISDEISAVGEGRKQSPLLSSCTSVSLKQNSYKSLIKRTNPKTYLPAADKTKFLAALGFKNSDKPRMKNKFKQLSVPMNTGDAPSNTPSCSTPSKPDSINHGKNRYEEKIPSMNFKIVDGKKQLKYKSIVACTATTETMANEFEKPNIDRTISMVSKGIFTETSNKNCVKIPVRTAVNMKKRKEIPPNINKRLNKMPKCETSNKKCGKTSLETAGNIKKRKEITPSINKRLNKMPNINSTKLGKIALSKIKEIKDTEKTPKIKSKKSTSNVPKVCSKDSNCNGDSNIEYDNRNNSISNATINNNANSNDNLNNTLEDPFSISTMKNCKTLSKRKNKAIIVCTNNNLINNNNNDNMENNNKLVYMAPPQLLKQSPITLNIIKRPRSRSTKFSNKKRHKVSHVIPEEVIVPRNNFAAPRWSNGWSWQGESFQSKVFLNVSILFSLAKERSLLEIYNFLQSDDPPVTRTCYVSMRHKEGDEIRPRDCVLLRAGNKKTDLPYVAKVASLWENPEDGNY